MKYKPVPPPAPRKLPPPDAAERIRALAADGWSVRGVAAQLGASQDLLRRWYESHPELKEAFEQGREEERHTLHNVLYRIATDPAAAPKDASFAALAILNSRHGYRSDDQQDQQNRVSITFNLPAAIPLEKFTVDHEHNSDDRTEPLPAKITRGA